MRPGLTIQIEFWFVAAFLFGFVSPARATPTYDVAILGSLSNLNQSSLTHDPITIKGEAANLAQTIDLGATASANPGGIGVEALTKIAATSGTSAGGTSEAVSTRLSSDIVISGNSPSGFVPASLNLLLTGLGDITFNETGLPLAPVAAGVYLELNLFVGTPSGVFNGRSSDCEIINHDPTGGWCPTGTGVRETGLLSSYTWTTDGSALITTPTIMWRVGTNELTLTLEAISSVDVHNPQLSGVDAQLFGGLFFIDTLTFPSGPVFNLPDGFTVNSADAQIVNNTFVGGSTPVPEPSAFMLLLSGFPIFVLTIRGRNAKGKR